MSTDYCRHVLVRVTRKKGTLTADEARDIVERVFQLAEYEVESSLKNDDFEDTESARLINSCDFSIENAP